MTVATFCIGLHVGPFDESLVQQKSETMANIRSCASCHVEVVKATVNKTIMEKKEENLAPSSKSHQKDYLKPRIN